MFLLADSSSAPWWSVSLGALVGGIISLVSTVCVGFWTDYLKQNQERRRTAALFATGFAAISRHLEENQVRTGLVHIGISAATGSMAPVTLVFPIRGSFLGVFDNLPALSSLPSQLLQRTVRHLIVVRGLVEDFTTLKDNVATAIEQDYFCNTLVSKIDIFQSEVPELIEDLLIEARVSRDTLTGFVTD